MNLMDVLITVYLSICWKYHVSFNSCIMYH